MNEHVSKTEDMLSATAVPRRPNLVSTWLAVAAVAAFGVTVVWHSRNGIDPSDAAGGSGICPTVTDPVAATLGGLPPTLVPALAYTSMQLCPAGMGGRRMVVHRLSDSGARGLVTRLNGLPERRSGTDCGFSSGVLVDLVLAGGGGSVVIHMDTAQCGEVAGPGGVRYGGDRIQAYLKDLVD